MATAPRKKSSFRSIIEQAANPASLDSTMSGDSLPPAPDQRQSAAPAHAPSFNAAVNVTHPENDAPTRSPIANHAQPAPDASAAVAPQSGAPDPLHMGNALAAAAAANPDDAYAQDLAASHARLTDILGSVPDVDYEGIYRNLIASAQARPIVQAPGKAQSFFAALGSPSDAPGLLAQSRSQEQQDRAQKLQDIFALKERALRGGIEQALAKNDFRKALALSEVAHEHAIEQAKISDARWFGHRSEIEANQREMFALASGETRARTEAQIKQSNMHLDQQQAASFAEAVTRATDAEAAKLDNDPMRMGRPVSPEEREAIRIQQFNLLARTLSQAGQLKPGNSAPDSSATEPAPDAIVDITDGTNVKHGPWSSVKAFLASPAGKGWRRQ